MSRSVGSATETSGPARHAQLEGLPGYSERGDRGDAARQLMRQQLTENALRSRGSFEYLVPPECRDGGRVDLDPGSARFP